MNHLSEEDLVLQYYGEPSTSDGAAHLAACEGCSARFADLQRVLNSLGDVAAPERGEDYGARVWAELRPRLEGRPVARVPNWRAWGAMTAMLVLGVAGFLAGRSSVVPKPMADRGVKERILLVALTDHLEKSRMVLAEVENSGVGNADFAFERSQAGDLLDANRLYRMTAVANGNMAAAGLLDDLERVLTDIAHAPENVTQEQMETLRDRIEQQGLTFKVKVFSTGLAKQNEGRL